MIDNDEQWKPIKDYEGMYEVSDRGRVKALERVKWNGKGYQKLNEIILSLGVTKKGYLVATLSKNGVHKTFRVHRLVADAFVPNDLCKEQVNHIDGDKKNNSAKNLEWVNNSENQNHAIKRGLRKSFKVDKEVLEKLYVAERKTIAEIAELFGVSKSTVFNLLKKNDIEMRSSSESQRKLFADMVEIDVMLKTMTQREIARKIGCSESWLSVFIKKHKNGGINDVK